MVDLDLEALTRETPVVKMPNGIEYNMADPMNMSAFQYHKLIGQYNKANELMNEGANTDETVLEMEQLLDTVCQAVLPDVPEEQFSKIGLGQKSQIVELFSTLMPEPEDNEEGDSEKAESQ